MSLTPVTVLCARSKNRSRTDIVANILAAALNGELRTRIMKEANLNSQRFDFYLKELSKLGLIDVSCDAGGKKLYSTSRKGRIYLAQYSALSSLISGI